MRRVLLALTCCALSAPPLFAQEAVSLRMIDQQVARIGHRLAIRNEPLCRSEGRTGFWSGFLASSLALYGRRERATLARTDRLGAQPKVTFLVPGGAADRAGILVGDVIVAVDGDAFPTTVPDKASYAQLARLEAATDGPVARYTLERAGQQFVIPLTHSPGCRSRLTVRDTPRLNGRADGTYAEINAGVVRLTADDAELAFFVGHEMAHNVLGHADWLDKVGRKTARIRETEMEADRFALRLMKGAGFDPMAAVRFWQKVDKKIVFDLLSDGTHLRDKARIRFLAQHAAALEAQ
jgi:hypothetical protein